MRSQDTFVYTIKEQITVDALQEIVHRLNKSQKRQEFLWSHPAYTGSNNQTSVAVIIQQDRKRLKQLRDGYKEKSEKQKKKSNPRIPRKKGQRRNSDLYTDENPKRTIKGLGLLQLVGLQQVFQKKNTCS